MGTWSESNFGNDAALDFAFGVNDIGALERAFQAVDGGWTDADVASDALAAAECVAAMLGHLAPDLPDDLKPVLAEMGPPSDVLIAAAKEAVRKVMTSSELLELWSEDNPEAWLAVNEGLLQRLQSAPDRDALAASIAAQSSEPLDIGHSCLICGRGIPDGELKVVVLEGEITGVWMMSTQYAHRQCLETTYPAPHFDEDGGLHPALVAQMNASLGYDPEV